MTDAEYQAWLEGDRTQRCILVEANVLAGGVETRRYLSTRDYATSPTDSPSNVAYASVVSGGIKITERMSIQGSASISFGDIEFDNTDGSLDGWLGDVWENRPIDIFMGDVRWPRSQFRRLFSGIQARMASRSRNTLNLELCDKLQRLNTPITDKRLGGTSDNKDRLIPICLGECHNIEPLLINPVTLTFQVHDGPIVRIIEVRDNGVPAAYVPDLAKGTFRLLAQPVGVITASVQGGLYDGTNWPTSAGSMIFIITSRYGQPATRFTGADYDTDNFVAFEAAHQQPLGIYLTERINILTVCANAAKSVGAELVMPAEGTLRMLKLGTAGLSGLTLADPSRREERSLRVSDRPPVQAAVKIAYCKNWTVQKNLQTGIPEAHKNLFALEWLTRTASDPGVAATYRAGEEPVEIETMLLREAEALAEAQRRLAVWSVQRTVYSYTGLPALMLQQLGRGQLLVDGRFGLAAGKPGQVVSIMRDWLAFRVIVEVLV